MFADTAITAVEEAVTPRSSAATEAAVAWASILAVWSAIDERA